MARGQLFSAARDSDEKEKTGGKELNSVLFQILLDGTGSDGF